MRVILPVMFVWSLLTPLAQGATYVIAPDGSGDFATIGDCVAHCGSGETIELSDGTFTGPGNVDIVVSGKTITIRSQSGSSANCRINVEGVPGITKRGFIIENSAVVTIENIAIENGYCTQDWGGGMVVRSQGFAHLDGVAFRGNYASWGGGLAIADGAGYVEGHNCRFLENIAESGGGAIYNNCTESQWYDSRFMDNTTNATGGAIYCDPLAEYDFFNCLFSRNLAGLEGGAIHYDGMTDVDIAGCTFCGNSCAGGSTLYVGASANFDLLNTLIVYTTEGYAINCLCVPTRVENNDIFDNASGDWTGNMAGFLGADCNIRENPQFCCPTPDDHLDWTLQSDSPCTSINSPCGQIGAFGAGCANTDPELASWGAIKRAFAD